MGGTRRLGASCLGLVALWASAVGAAEPRLQAVGQSSLGYTDNAQAAPSDAAADGRRTRSAFWMLSPGLVLALRAPRLLQRISYRYEYDFYFNRRVSSASSNRFEYLGFFDLSPRVNLSAAARAVEANRFDRLAFTAPGASSVGALPSGGGSFLAASGDQTFDFDVAEGWRAWQGGRASIDTPLFDTQAPRTIGFALRAGLERSYLLNALGLEARGDYTRVEHGVGLDRTPLGLQRQLLGTGVAIWRHDWSRDVTSRAEAGASRLERLDTHSVLWTPVARLLLAYATGAADAQLTYAHTLTTNALFGESLLVDEVRLRGALPLSPRGRVNLAASGGFQMGRLLDRHAALRAHLRVLLADVALGWRATKLLELGVRYEHIDQRSDADAPPLPLSLVQNSVLLGATLRFPQDRRMPLPYRAPRRVDRADELRDGTRPSVVDTPSAPSQPR